MSGVVGIFHRDGAPVDAGLLQAMTDFIAYRGPDGQEKWAGDSVGLGHTGLQTTRATGSYDRQPGRLGSLCIVSDARLDAADELRKKLELRGRKVEVSASDSVLILHAYLAWGPECLEHLRGDFAFGIWDAEEKTLFCARDHFGIKPFYYAALGNLFLFSNTLNCLRQHPAVTKALNESAIGDFLLFGLNYDEATTSFRDIQRLPPAHWVLVSSAALEVRRYWYPPSDGRIRFARGEDYVERLKELLKAAVADRLNSDRVGIFLSGGLDSGAVAATAKELSLTCRGVPELRSYTLGYDDLIPDDEGVHARALAAHLGIPNKYMSLDHVDLFGNWAQVTWRFPEPVDNPLITGMLEQFRMVAGDCRTALSGEGSDNLMYFQMWPYIKDLWRKREWSQLAVETTWFASIRPIPWRGARQRIRSLFKKISGRATFPIWIAPEFARRADLPARWIEGSKLMSSSKGHSARPKAHASMLLPLWSNSFEQLDPGVTHYPVEVRYPFLDLRIVDYLLAIPAFPWCYKKELLRRALIARIPEDLRTRRKTPLRADPVLIRLQKGVRHYPLEGQICEFVRPSAFDILCDRIAIEPLRGRCLDLWLKGI